MRNLVSGFKPLLFFGIAGFLLLGLFRHSIEHAMDAHPLLASSIRGPASSSVHFSPDEDLEGFDRELLLQARSSIDIAMYSFTDRTLALALLQLARRGVQIRIYRDQEEFRREQIFARSSQSNTTALLRELPGVHIRVKGGPPRSLMHEKSYSIDGKWLREGSANWSPGAEKIQDNCIYMTTDAQQIAAYERKFNRMWNRTSNLVVQ